MTPDQWQQLLGFGTALATAIGGNGVIRGRQVKKQVKAHSSLQGEIQGLRKDLAETRDKIVRLEVRIEATEKADDQMSKSMDQVRMEMHSLTGRMDAATAPITEILTMVKSAKEKSAARAAAVGTPVDEEPPVTGTVTFKEEKKKNG